MGQDNPLQPGDADYDPAWRPASPLTRRQAEALTEKIRKAADHTWDLLSEAYEKKAWAKLGYSSWAQYTGTEFGISRSRSYQLLNQSWMVKELEVAAGVTVHNVDTRPMTEALTEAVVRDLRPVLPEVVEKVRTAVKGRPKKTRPAIVAEIVGEERAKVKAGSSVGRVEVEAAMNHLVSTVRSADPAAFTPAGWKAILPTLRDKLPSLVAGKLAALEEKAT